MIAFASLAILAALLPNLAFAQQICPGTSVYTLESQFDILGNDIGSVVSASNACACATLCNNEPRCSAYVFDESGILNIRNCYLKQVTPTANTVTYFKGSTVLGINGTFQDVSLSSRGNVNDIETCTARCTNSAACRFVQVGRDGSGFTCFAADVATNAQRRIGVKGTPFVRPVTSTVSTAAPITTTAVTTEPATSATEAPEPTTSATQRTGVPITSTTSATAPTTATTVSSTSSPEITAPPPPASQGGGDNKGLVVGLAVTGSLVGALLLVAAAMYAVKMSRRKGLDHDAVYTLPWRKSGVFSASAGVGASSVVNGATGSMPRTAPTVGRGSGNPYGANGTTLYPPNYQQPPQEGFTIEQYLAAGWTMEQINTFNPPTLPSEPAPQ